MSNIPSEITQILGNSKHELDVEQKLLEYFTNDKDLESKTDLENPIKWVILNVIQEILEKSNMPKSSELLKFFIKKAYILKISGNRKGREELLQAFIAFRERQKTDEQLNPLTMKVEKK